MHLVFLNSKDDLDQFSKMLFKILELNEFKKTDSHNVYNGTYASYSVLGIKIKLEYNSYDYEENYNYMMTIAEDFTSKINLNARDVDYFAEIIIHILKMNTNINMAREIDDELKILN